MHGHPPIPGKYTAPAPAGSEPSRVITGAGAAPCRASEAAPRRGKPAEATPLTGRVLRGAYRYVLLICVALAPFLKASAQHDLKAYAALQERLFPVVLSSPADAKPVLDSLLRHEGQVPDTVLARTFVLLSIYHGVMGQNTEGIHRAQRALPLYAGHDGQRASVLRNLASLHRQAGDIPASFQHVREALALHQAMGDSTGIALDLSELASTFRMDLRYDSAVTYLVLSLRFLEATRNTDPRHLLVTRQKLANTYLTVGRYDLALDLLQQLVPELLVIGDRSTHLAAAISLAECHMKLGDVPGSRAQLGQVLPDLRALGNRDLLSLALAKEARALVLMGDSAAALRTYADAMGLAMEVRSTTAVRMADEYLRLLVARGRLEAAAALVNDPLLDTLAQQADHEAHALFLRSSSLALMALGQRAEAIARSQQADAEFAVLQATSSKRAAADLQDRHRAEISSRERDFAIKQLGLQRRVNLFLALAIALLLAVVGYASRTQRLRSSLKARELEAAQQETTNAQDRMRAAQQIATIRQATIDQLKQELLASTRESHVLREQVDNLVQQADEEQYGSGPDTPGDQDRAQWTYFLARFNLANPTFIKDLLARFPDLTKGDIELCALLMMNLSQKEIAGLLHIAPESVAKKKYRIGQKMQLPEHTALEDVLKTIG